MKSLQAEIARRANVSQSTVSRALRNHPALPRETCERIQMMARQLGYAANPLLSAVLGSVRRRENGCFLGTLAFLTAHPDRNSWKNVATYRDFLQGAKKRASEQGFAIEAHWAADPELTGKRLSDILQARGILGVILGARGPEGSFPELQWEHFAVERIGLSQRAPRFHCVVNHQIHTVRLVAGQLADRGYKRIGLAISMWQNEAVDENWKAGFLVWQNSLPEKQCVPIHAPQTLAEEPFLEWLKHAKPDAVIAVNPAVIGWLKQAGYGVPGDMGVALLDWHDNYGNVAGADQNNLLVGAVAVDQLLGQLRRNERGIPAQPLTTLIESTWHEGYTVRKAP